MCVPKCRWGLDGNFKHWFLFPLGFWDGIQVVGLGGKIAHGPYHGAISLAPGSRLLTLPSPSPECWGYGHTSPCPGFRQCLGLNSRLHACQAWALYQMGDIAAGLGCFLQLLLPKCWIQSSRRQSGIWKQGKNAHCPNWNLEVFRFPGRPPLSVVEK